MATATPLGPRFEDALVYALHAHAGQTRKSTSVPYAAHLLGVAALVLEDGGDEDQAIGALLHDAAEDAGGRLEDIRGRYGARVAEIVEGCSDSYDGEPKAPWRERKEAYVARLPHEPEHVLRVSLADNVHNPRTLLRDLLTEGPSVRDRFNAKRPEDQVGYYRSVIEAVRGKLDSPLLEELERTVDEIAVLSGQ
jgi:(p)ppGpp synthase/HD superfamily hydrolase